MKREIIIRNLYNLIDDLLESELVIYPDRIEFKRGDIKITIEVGE